VDPRREAHAAHLDALLDSDSDTRGVAGDAFAEFVVAHTQPLLRLAHALTGNPHDAWDLVQEALARTGERWDREIAQPGAYTRTVMVHLNIDRLRRLRRELLVFAPHDNTRRVVEAFNAPETGMDADLLEALATLSPRQRTAIALRYVEDLDVASIAERMCCSEGTVKSQLSRGTARLKERLATTRTGASGGPTDHIGQESS
jgi:RNA polymerase sigma-70 factor (sigma-E family)